MYDDLDKLGSDRPTQFVLFALAHIISWRGNDRSTCVLEQNSSWLLPLTRTRPTSSYFHLFHDNLKCFEVSIVAFRLSMVQRADHRGPSRVREMSDPTEPTHPTMFREQHRGATMQSFMDSFISPFVQCVSPPLQACVAPSVPWQPRQQQRPASPLVSVTPVSGSSYVNHQFVENDVLCGKGRSSICHPGNQRFRELIEANRGEYARATRKQKAWLANAIVDLIRNAQPPGRFLLRDVESGRWYDIGRNRSFEKTSQSLREKATGMGNHNQGERVHGRPGLVIPEHLKHIYQQPGQPTEYRNPPHTADTRQGGHHSTTMYQYPISSASSFEVVSPCGSNLSDTQRHLNTPPSLMAHRPMVTPSPRACSPMEIVHLPPRATCGNPPQDLRKCVSTPLPSNTKFPVAANQDGLPSSKSLVFQPPVCLTGMFDTPVDGHSPAAPIVPPSAVRRSRHSSGEDGLAALSAAAFLKLDDIE